MTTISQYYAITVHKAIATKHKHNHSSRPRAGICYDTPRAPPEILLSTTVWLRVITHPQFCIRQTTIAVTAMTEV